MAKFVNQLFNHAWHFFMHMPNISIYISIVYAKYQKASLKSLVQVDFPVYALYKHK